MGTGERRIKSLLSTYVNIPAKIRSRLAPSGTSAIPGLFPAQAKYKSSKSIPSFSTSRHVATSSPRSPRDRSVCHVLGLFRTQRNRGR